MHRRLTALLIPLALTGCATSSRVSADEGLRASLGRSRESVRVALSEPAYVAVFEVVPGRRVELLYPAAESDPSLIAAGRTMLESGGQTIYPYRYSASRRGAPLLYMIASRHPLDEALIREMRQAWGVLDSDQFRSDDPTRTMENLASLVVPADQPQTDWADDVLSTRRPGPRYTRSDRPRNSGGGEPGTSVYCGVGGTAGGGSREEICPGRRPTPTPRPTP